LDAAPGTAAVTEDERILQEDRSARGRQDKADADTLGALLSTPNGRYWVERLLDFCKHLDCEHVSIDDTIIKLGRKQVGVYLLDQIEQHAPDALIRMIVERRARVEALRVKKIEDDKRQRRADRPLDLGDMPDETPFEAMMDQQARDLAPRETK
jgi:hypothetical protein